jgi:hemerythrin superfamily protein
MSKRIKGQAMTMQNQTSARAGAGGTISNGTTDAITLLSNDHAEVAELFEEYEALVEGAGDEGEKQALAERICALLTTHATIEEEIFYPAAREVLDEQQLLDEAEVEHATAKDLIQQIQSMDPTDELYDAKVTVLGEYVSHHVQEEERELFPRCQGADIDLEELGEELSARREELMEELGLEEEE